MIQPFYEALSDGFIVRIKAHPGAKREDFGGLIEGEHQNHFLKISISTPPEDGKANKALVLFMAKAWKVSPLQFKLIKGQTSRLKIFKIEMSSDIEKKRLISLLEAF